MNTQPQSTDLLSSDPPPQTTSNHEAEKNAGRDEESGSSQQANYTSTSPYVAMEIAGARLNQPGMPEQFENEGQENNDDDENQSIDMSSVLTADGIHDVPGFCVVCLVILVGDMSVSTDFCV